MGLVVNRLKKGIIVSWLGIAAAVLFMVSPYYSGAREGAPDPMHNQAMQFSGRFLVGIDILLGGAVNLEQHVEQLRRDLEKPENSGMPVKIVPIIFELSGREAALEELERLRENYTDDETVRDIALFSRLYHEGEQSLTHEQRRTIERYGWIGKLALSQDKESSHPQRQAVVQSAVQTVIVISLFAIAVLAALTTGFFLLAFTISLRCKGMLRSRLSMPPTPRDSLLESFAIYMTGFFALPAAAVLLLPDKALPSLTIMIIGVLVAVFWPHLRGSSRENIRNALGWHRGRGFWRETGAGIIGYITGLPLMLGAFLIVLLLTRLSGITPSHPVAQQIGGDPLQIVMLFILACLWAPVVEEFFFRGVFYGYLRHHASWVVSGLATALLFAVIHPQGWIGVPLLATSGFILSAIREWRGSIIAPISAHALNNGVALFLAMVALS
ncbi:MAG TPA: CPBP family intramembrane glutamic endopeptidase [Acidobacteriota bacterium]|nr:CPBP family intramembrane glutamic endopeptidase [Acidobacteriota bacterium]